MVNCVSEVGASQKPDEIYGKQISQHAYAYILSTQKFNQMSTFRYLHANTPDNDRLTALNPISVRPERRLIVRDCCEHVTSIAREVVVHKGLAVDLAVGV